jgi:Spy/CpxP family protein refolding chaperone
MTKALDLTPDQATKITEIFQDQAPAMKALHEDTSLNKDQKRAKMKELRDGMDSKISAVLTPEQNTKWQAQRAQMKEKREKGGGGGSAPSPEASPTATPN